jgi:hypothetical protein
LSHSASSFLCWLFSRWVSRTICLDWLQTMILPISTSWVARMTATGTWYIWGILFRVTLSWQLTNNYIF